MLLQCIERGLRFYYIKQVQFMPNIRFLPMGTVVESKAGETILETAQRVGVKSAATCGGRGICRGCRVRVVDGEDALSDMEYAEQSIMGNTFFLTKERLACQTRISGDIVVEFVENDSVDKRERGRAKALNRARELAQRKAARALDRQKAS